MKTKGRRQSTNVEDKRDEITVVPRGERLFTGGVYDPDTMDDVPTRMKREEQERRDPKTTSKTQRIQVTPGKWKTKSK